MNGRERAQVSGLRRSGDGDRRSALDLGDRRGSQHLLHLGDILDLDRLGAYVRQRLLLVLQLLLLLPLFLGFLACSSTVSSCLLSWVMLSSSCSMLAWICSMPCSLGHRGGLLCDLLLPLLLGERVSGHRTGGAVGFG